MRAEPCVCASAARHARPSVSRRIRDPEDWSFLRRPALLGFLAVVSICVGASLPSSPFKLEMGGTGSSARPTGLDHVDAAGRRRRVRRDVPLRPRLARAVPDTAGPRRRADPPAGVHAGAVDPAPPGGGPAVQPGRVLLRRAGRDDEPPHQPVPLRPGHPGFGSVRVGRRPAVGEHARTVRAALLDAGRAGPRR